MTRRCRASSIALSITSRRCAVRAVAETSNLPRTEPWLIAGGSQHTPLLVAFVCPHCEHEIRSDA